MKILGWNCRGIYNALTIRALRAQIKWVKPDVIFLSKTKADGSRMEFVRNALKFDKEIVVEAKGCASGLCILWRNCVSITEVEFNKNLIVVNVSNPISDWLLIGFYGPPYHIKKAKAWGNLFALLEAHQGL